jgi:hypothetical protein
MPGWPDRIIVAAIVALANAMIKSAGLQRGFEVMQRPDGLERAASAVNLPSGRLELQLKIMRAFPPRMIFPLYVRTLHLL